MKTTHKHIQRKLAIVRHKGFDVKVVKPGVVGVYKGKFSEFEEKGGCIHVYRNPINLLKTIREQY